MTRSSARQWALIPLSVAAFGALGVIAAVPPAAAAHPCPTGRTPVFRASSGARRVRATRSASPRNVRSQTAAQNAAAAQNKEPNGGPYGPNTCKQGFVWRDAPATPAETGSCCFVGSADRRSDGTHHRSQWGRFAVRLRLRRLSPQLLPGGEGDLRPGDRSGDSEVLELERQHHLRQRHQHEHLDVLLSPSSNAVPGGGSHRRGLRRVVTTSRRRPSSTGVPSGSTRCPGRTPRSRTPAAPRAWRRCPAGI